MGVDEIEAELLPEQKLARVKALREAKKTVAMVGDGVNDAPALVAASVGIAMGSGSELAREKADIMLVSDNLNQFVEIVRVARRTRDIIWFNFAGTILVDVIGLFMALFGLIGPTMAAVIHTSSELGFILNSARLLPGAAVWTRPEVWRQGLARAPAVLRLQAAKATTRLSAQQDAWSRELAAFPKVLQLRAQSGRRRLDDLNRRLRDFLNRLGETRS